jgi:hypothetical protein
MLMCCLFGFVAPKMDWVQIGLGPPRHRPCASLIDEDARDLETLRRIVTRFTRGSPKASYHSRMTGTGMARAMIMATTTLSVQEFESMPSVRPVFRTPPATTIGDGKSKTIVCSACAGNRTIVVPPVVFACPICAGSSGGARRRHSYSAANAAPCSPGQATCG